MKLSSIVTGRTAVKSNIDGSRIVPTPTIVILVQVFLQRASYNDTPVDVAAVIKNMDTTQQNQENPRIGTRIVDRHATTYSD